MPPEPDTPRSKRSQTVTLVLLAGAGAGALSLGHLDPSQREEDVLVYANPEACIAGHIRTEPDCRRDYGIARATYPDAAPRYATMAECEGHHGANHCLAGASVSASASGRFVPLMAGYLVSRRPEQDLDPQPVYDHRPNEAVRASSGSGGGGYCTSWGGRVVTSSGGTSSSARVASAAVRKAAFGGFGSTGRGFSSHGLSSHGSGG